MNRQLIAVVFVLNCAVCEAQRTTELYIPIGRSPGLSAQGKTVIGTVISVNGDEIIVGDRIIRLTAGTKIFLDRSRIKQVSLYGVKADITVGAFVEGYLSEWVKIRSN